MGLAKMKWMSLCVVLSVTGCDPQVVDSYCQVYHKVVRGKGDGAIKAPLEVKKRILANELSYRKLCPKAGS